MQWGWFTNSEVEDLRIYCNVWVLLEKCLAFNDWTAPTVQIHTTKPAFHLRKTGLYWKVESPVLRNFHFIFPTVFTHTLYELRHLDTLKSSTFYCCFPDNKPSINSQFIHWRKVTAGSWLNPTQTIQQLTEMTFKDIKRSLTPACYIILCIQMYKREKSAISG